MTRVHCRKGEEGWSGRALMRVGLRPCFGVAAGSNGNGARGFLLDASASFFFGGLHMMQAVSSIWLFDGRVVEVEAYDGGSSAVDATNNTMAMKRR